MNPKSIQNPPNNFFQKLRFLGPGFILSASIVGSGELIATTLLGAEGGFVTFWVILVSCLIKVAIQLEFGKNAIITGNPLMAEFNNLSGPKLGKGKWTVWLTFGLTILKILQLGGMLGGAAIVLSLIFPVATVSFWVVLLGITLSLLIFKNYYYLIEKVATLMVFGFTIFTIASLVGLFFTPFSFSIDEVLSGLSFNLPNEVIFVAIGAFGITGVASDEIIAYTYWCQEKGYAKYTGPNDGSEEWKVRAKAWIKIMYLDAFLAMIIYTLVTASFYLLGAAVLHEQEEIPDGTELINFVANIYTESLGQGARLGYLTGAFFALYSSVFATLAYWSRLFPDVFSQFGWIPANNESNRKRWVKLLAWILPILWVITFLFVELPGFMILSGGVVGSVLLLVVVVASVQFRKKNRGLQIMSEFWSEIMFWLSVISILMISLYGIFKLF
ncbi:Mn2+/Fe2+ NRAMP family transporter [Algoriphagus boseongensis]|uniref:Mn2+/Fe2+ NRAMP family transporter n=1 Tax=Algoriphagus boseongensis TaxID=1442587 RepID=A0A4R6TBF5_9BACT|nr:Nramp family divalent metal transporter [Algoriphagus boseongensis]TDQ18995.1 Mn2+/Fe2+ NRAMP family transporter [Algoriphagus boseongensis]